MLRGMKKVTCPHCGHSFVTPDLEDNATVKSMPVHCPRCGADVRMNGILGFLSNVFRQSRNQR